MKERRISLVLNLLIIVFEIIAFIFSYVSTHKLYFEFYTEDSNILALISSSIFVYYILSKKKIPNWVNIFKYISTVCLSVTFLVVIFILAPMSNFNYQYLLFSGAMLFHHTLCPILSIITFLFYDKLIGYSKKDVIKGLSFTFVYAFVAIILNIVGILDGPYPFLRVRSQTIIESVIWSIVVLGFAYLIARMLILLYNRIRSK